MSLVRRIFGSFWFKLAVALAVLALLVRFNRLDLAALRTLGDTWPWLLLAFCLMLPPFAIVSHRFRLVLRSQGIDVSEATAVRWTMIGSFFDLAMPSSNGGDVIKAGYVMKHVGPGTRTRAVMAVAFDRVIGLLGLFCLAAVAGTIGWSVVRELPGAGLVLAASFAASLGVLVVFRVLGARRLYTHPSLVRRLESGQWGLRLKQLIAAFNNLRERPRYLLMALGLSMLNHVFWCASLLCIARALGHVVRPVEGFVVFPMAIFGNVFGVAGGFGLGTAVFDLFLSQVLGIRNGAVVGLLFQSLNAATRLLGLPFYVLSERTSRVEAVRRHAVDT